MTSENDLLGFMYACPFGLMEIDESGRIGMINPNAMNQLFPLARGRGVDNFFDVMEKYAPELRNFVDGFADDSGPICDGHRIFVDIGRHSGERHPKVLSCSLIKRGPGQIMATLTDVTTQVVQEHRLRQADMWFSALIDEINDHALLTVDGAGTILSVNKSFTRQTGYATSDVIGQPATLILSGEQADSQPTFVDQLSLATRNGWQLFEGWERRADGEKYWCQCLLVARAEHEDDENRAFSMVLRDVPQQSGEAAHDLIELLTRDYLTGAANRMQFNKVLRREYLRHLRHNTPLSLIILDLDHFKGLNDTYGHPAGDAVLKHLAQTCMEAAPKRATFARLGGEEFALLVPRCGLDDAAELADKLRRKIADQSVPLSEGTISVTASFGCAEIGETDGSTEELVVIADRRLYEAKNAGRNRVGALSA